MIKISEEQFLQEIELLRNILNDYAEDLRSNKKSFSDKTLINIQSILQQKLDLFSSQQE